MEHKAGFPSSLAFSLGGRSWDSSSPLVIAEIGTGHGGDGEKALDLIAAAAEAGAACAKFQLVHPEEILHPLTGEVPLPSGRISLYERFRALETPLEFQARCREECEKRGLIYLCTPFGTRSAAELLSLGVKAFKVASPELNHFPLLDAIADTGLPCILSSGVSLLSDIEAALARIFSERALLHCVTAYPAPAEDYNLRLLPSLSRLFGIPVGLSDHSLDPSLVPLLALSQGAAIIEKHICLSRMDPGLDDPIALDPKDFSSMCINIHTMAKKAPEEIIDEMTREYGDKIVQSVLGDGVKRLAPSEEANYHRSNRSLHALHEIRRGEIFSKENTGILRTEKILRPGLSPSFLNLVMGRHAAQDIPDGEGICWEDIGPPLNGG